MTRHDHARTTSIHVCLAAVACLLLVGLALPAAAQSRGRTPNYSGQRRGERPQRVARLQSYAQSMAPRQQPPQEELDTPAPSEAQLEPIPEGREPAEGETFDEGGDCDSCGGDGCDDCCGVGPAPYDWCGPCCEDEFCGGGAWGRIEYLLWWGRGSSMPPLVTTSPQNSFGVLGQPGTTVVVGDRRFDNDIRSGGRADFGVWLDSTRDVGFGGNFFSVDTAETRVELASGGTPLLARPFFNVTTNAQDSQVVASADVSEGSVAVFTTNDVLGAEAYFRKLLVGRSRNRADFLFGYRFARVDESLKIVDSLTAIDPGGIIPLGTVITGTDLFDTQNTFHGGQIGLVLDETYTRWTWQVIGKIAFGNMRQNVVINGTNTVTVPGFPPDTTSGSLLAQPTNIGRYQRDTFSVIPEFDITLGYRLTTRWRATLGYTFMYISDVAQAAQQIDFDVNPTQIGGGALVGQAVPAFQFNNSGYWLQGINFGLEARF